MDRYRVTIWPGEPVPVPTVPRDAVFVDAERAADKGAPFLVFNRFPRDLALLPDELYLRELRDLDVTDPEALQRFTTTYGRLSTSASWNELPGWYVAPGSPHPLLHTLEQVRKETKRYRDGGTDPLSDVGWFDSVSLEEVALYITLIRDMTRVWQYHQGLLTFEETVASWENPLWFSDPVDVPSGEAQVMVTAAAEEVRRTTDPTTSEERFDQFLGSMGRQHLEHASGIPQCPRDLYRFLGDFLGAALQAFHVGPEITDENGTPLYFPDARKVSLYSALCLQLANHIAENADYRTCKKCGVLFVRQQGRAEVGQYRTGGELFFCTKKCARAYTQKEYRKRQAVTKKKEM